MMLLNTHVHFVIQNTSIGMTVAGEYLAKVASAKIVKQQLILASLLKLLLHNVQ